jgi:hypothetical protein
VSRVRHEQQLLQPQVADQSIPHWGSTGSKWEISQPGAN